MPLLLIRLSNYKHLKNLKENEKKLQLMYSWLIQPTHHKERLSFCTSVWKLYNPGRYDNTNWLRRKIDSITTEELHQRFGHANFEMLRYMATRNWLKIYRSRSWIRNLEVIEFDSFWLLQALQLGVTTDFFLKWFTMVERQFPNQLKIIRTDNGTEIVSNQKRLLPRRKSTSWATTQNRVQHGALKQSWSTYVLNRVPKKRELKFERKLSFKFIHAKVRALIEKGCGWCD